MMRAEFEKLIGIPITPEAYAIVEVVYMNHPSMNDNKMAKQDVARAFKLGYLIDMYPRAKAIADAEESLRLLRGQKDDNEQRCLKEIAAIREVSLERLTNLNDQERLVKQELYSLVEKGVIL